MYIRVARVSGARAAVCHQPTPVPASCQSSHSWRKTKVVLVKVVS